jgi:hypothetical protein
MNIFEKKIVFDVAKHGTVHSPQRYLLRARTNGEEILLVLEDDISSKVPMHGVP